MFKLPCIGGEVWLMRLIRSAGSLKSLLPCIGGEVVIDVDTIGILQWRLLGISDEIIF